MIGKASNSQIRPVALGSTVQSSVYGSCIPVIYGRVKTALYLIWAANLRKISGSGKKGKGLKGKKGKSAPQYAQNVDFLLGHNPILTPLQFWQNQDTKYPLNFVKFTGTLVIPDPQFYAIVGVTSSQAYNFVVNDYGGPGQITLSGSTEVPCWNTANIGPNPTRSASFLYNGFTYRWTPAMGNAITTDPGSAVAGLANFYYAELWPDGSSAYGKKQAGTAVPAGALDLTFEPVLGEGPEYADHDQTTGQPLNQQQILYPMYAGLGSNRLKMGSSTAIPDIRAEVIGAGAMYATGDAEFADMLEDIVAQGLGQAGATVQYNLDSHGNIVTGAGGPFSTPPFTKLQRGLGAYNFPGPIQMKYMVSVEAFDQGPMMFDQPNTAGNVIVVLATGGATLGNLESFGPSPGPCSDTAGNSYTQVFPGGLNYQAWYATDIAAFENNFVTVGNRTYNGSLTIMEIAGVDTFDASAIAAIATDGSLDATVTTTNAGGLPCYLLACSFTGAITRLTDPQTPLWETLSNDFYTDSYAGQSVNHQLLQSRVVYNPGAVTLTLGEQGIFPSVADGMAILAFKATQPSPWPRALGNILDSATLNHARRQCRAFGLYGSLVMDSQQKASDWMETLYDAMNTAPVWSGFTLKSVPKSEASYAGGGVTYTAPTANGPLYRLQEADFVSAGDQNFIQVERAARTDVPNILQIQCPNRDSDYNDVTVSQPETGAIALFSPRKDSPKQFRMIQDVAVARKVLDVMVREQNYLLNTYKFTLQAKFKLLEPMDLITIPDPQTGLNLDAAGNDTSIPVQFTEINENADLTLECEAVDYIYGCHAPIDLAVTGNHRSQVLTGASAGAINAPIIFEPPPRLLAQQNQGEIWMIVSRAFVPAPVDPPVPSLGIGGAVPAGTYYVMVTYVNAIGGESLPSPESVDPVIVVDASGSQTISVPSPPAVDPQFHVTGWNVYITGPDGQQGTETKQNASPIAIGTGYTQSAGIVPGTALPQDIYGGAIVYLSTDGGSSYNQVGAISGTAITGLSTADWPAATDPDSVADTSNDLLLDLAESGGALQSYATIDEDNFVYPCYIAGGGLNFIPYELMSYAVATLTTIYNYSLSAQTPNYLRRSLFATPQVGAGVDHPLGSRWAFLDPAGTGIFKITMDPLWIGQTLYFKFLPFNVYGGGTPALSDVTAYPYTPIGVAQYQNPNAVNYTQTPGIAISRTGLTLSVVAVNEQFPSNTAHYNARTITIPDFNERYFVTIHDPGYRGDVGTNNTALQIYAETTQSKVGLPGYIYLGSIGPSPQGDVATEGGWPPQQTYLVNGT